MFSSSGLDISSLMLESVHEAIFKTHGASQEGAAPCRANTASNVPFGSWRSDQDTFSRAIEKTL
jgi:hypothetical protein